MLTFEKLFTDASAEEIITLAEESDLFEMNRAAIALFKGIDEKKEELDQVIEKYLKNWTIERISKVSLAVLRLAVYEIYFADDISDEIAISEAVKITQTYSLKDDVNFVNGVLAAVVKDR